MQFSTLLISTVALLPSALACLNVNITYTLQTASSESNIYAQFLDNGRVTCYYNQPNPATGAKEVYALNNNPNNVAVVNDTYQQCVAGYWATFQVDLSDTKDKKGNNKIQSYSYLDQHGQAQSYTGISLGSRITTAAAGNNPEIWTWLANPFC
ncbi:hypothetical protein OCU04_002176 [Sclerotinia nivalis]|uniref:Uncharacterized protein n=1 Tax=Sclerotinia nivalis TaxID=352851 RepID=A0A9X0DS61_9HELO|nr:hypothetical protein OCU04_002176 [Sclerotinia nivalis]